MAEEEILEEAELLRESGSKEWTFSVMPVSQSFPSSSTTWDLARAGRASETRLCRGVAGVTPKGLGQRIGMEFPSTHWHYSQPDTETQSPTKV